MIQVLQRKKEREAEAKQQEEAQKARQAELDRNFDLRLKQYGLTVGELNKAKDEEMFERQQRKETRTLLSPHLDEYDQLMQQFGAAQTPDERRQFFAPIVAKEKRIMAIDKDAIAQPFFDSKTALELIREPEGPTPKELAEERNALNEQKADIAIRSFIFDIRQMPDMANEDRTDMFLKLIEENPGLTGTQAYKNFRITMKDLGVTEVGDEPEAGLPDQGDREAAQQALNVLRSPGQGNIEAALNLSAYADMPEDILTSLQQQNFLVGSQPGSVVPFMDPEALTPGDALTSDEGVKAVFDYVTGLNNALDQWAATGWKKGSIYNILRPSVRSRIMKEITDSRSPLERGTTAQPGPVDLDEKDTNKIPKHIRIGKAIEGILSAGWNANHVEDNPEQFAAQLALAGLTVEDVLPELKQLLELETEEPEPELEAVEGL